MSHLSKVPISQIEARLDLYSFPDKKLLSEVRAVQFAQMMEGTGIIKVESSILSVKGNEIPIEEVRVDCDALGTSPALMGGYNFAMRQRGIGIQTNWMNAFETSSPKMPDIPFGMGVNLVFNKS